MLRLLLHHALHVPEGEPALPLEVVDEPHLARYVTGFGTRGGDRGLLAEVDGRLVGGAWLRRWTRDERGYGHVADDVPELSVAVLPGHRGRGLGTALLRRLLDDASADSDAVSLSVDTSNPAARLYERLGFRVVGRSPRHLVMRLDLGRPAAPDLDT